MRVLGLIPARGGSKSVPGKNIAPLAGRPLLTYTVAAAAAATRLDRVILSTDDEGIAEVGRAAGVEVPFLRPAALADDAAPTLGVVRHALDFLEAEEDDCPDAVCLLQPTAPLREGRHIDEAIALLITEDADSVVSVCPVPHQYHAGFSFKIEAGRLAPFLADGLRYTRRQDLPELFTRNGAIYVTRRAVIRGGSLYGERCLPYRMAPEVSVNIDSPLDFLLAEALLTQRAGT